MAEICVKTVEPLSVMSLSFTGPYDQTGDRLDKLMAWLLREGHPCSSPPLAVYYDDPEKVPQEDLRADVCLPVAEACEGGQEVQRKNLPGGEFAFTVFEGPYSEIAAVYQELFAWIQENGYRYAEGMGTREVFLTIPGDPNAPGGPVTEVQVPVEQAGAE